MRNRIAKLIPYLHEEKATAFVLLAVLALVGGVHLATLRSGHEWGDDFSLYVAHARNLVEGRPYANTGYIYNPDNPVISPRSYPPIFPLLLAPVYYLFGLNLMVMKVFVVLLFTITLLVLALILRKRLPLPFVLGCLVLFALNPYAWQHKDRLLSETPFMLFAYLALLLADRALNEAGSRKRRLALALFAGLAAYLALGTRTVGVVLLPCIVGCELLRCRRFGLVSLATTAVFLSGVVVQKMLLPLDGSYLDQLVFDPLRYLRVGVSLVKAMALFVDNGHSRTAGLMLYVVLLTLAGWGYLARLRQGVTVYELFAAGNCLLLTLWPAAEYDQRFLLPILPLFLLYVGEGLCRFRATSWGGVVKPAAVALALLVLLSYAGVYRRLETGPVRQGVSAPDAVALFDWINKRTAPEEVFLFQKPRALALYTRRQAIALHKPDSEQQLWQFLHKVGVTHIIVCQSPTLNGFQDSRKMLQPFVLRHGERLDKVYANPGFAIYRIREHYLAAR